MSAERYERLRALFDAACELPAPARDAFVQSECGEDLDLAAELRRLLAQNAKTGAWLDAPLLPRPPTSAAFDPSRAPSLEQIGPYRILRTLGEGGMGLVYEAQQEQPRRRIALKVVRPGLATPAVLRRFRREAEVLGQLQHPGIARIFEAGVHERPGHPPVPYYAMELIAGLPLDLHAERARLSLRQRCELIARVCDAVQHAHARGVIHRDLKPANVLVVADQSTPGADLPAEAGAAPCVASADCGAPRILDFGVARLIDPDQALTRQTDVGQIIGTLTYMSPEQMSGGNEAVDARSDVYSLGVMLYELVAGRLPHDVRARPLPEAIRIIREDEATRLSSIDARLRGDMETIVAKALEKSPARRYASAAELAADLRRYLADQPIRARPVSTFYQIRKFTRRNRGLVFGLATAAAVLVVGATTSTVLAIRAEAQRRRADERANYAAEQSARATARESEARWLAYRASLAAAANALQGGDVGAARQSLHDAPSELQGWEHRYLAHLADRSVRSFEGHRGAPRLALSADDQRIATLDDAGVVRVWDVATGELLRAWPQAGGRWGPALNATGEFVYWSDDQATLCCAGVSDGATRWQYSAPVRITPDAIARDGTCMVCSVEGGHDVLILDPADGATRARFARAGEPVYGASISPDGAWIITQDASGIMDVMDGRTGAARVRRNSWGAQFSRDGAVLLSHKPTSTGFTIELLAVPSFAVTAEFELSSARQAAVDYESSSGSLVASDAKGAIRIAQPDGVNRAESLLAHPVCTAARFTADGTRIFTAGGDGCVRMWNRFSSPAPLISRSRARDWSFGGAIDPAGRQIARVGWGVVSAIDVETCATRWQRSVSRTFLRAADWEQSGARLAVAGQEAEVVVLDAADGAIVRKWPTKLGGLVLALVWLPDRPDVVLGLETGELHILNVETGTTRLLGRHESPVTCLVSSPVGQRLISGGGDGQPGGDFGVYRSGRNDNRVRIWDLARHELVQQFTGPPGAVTCVATSPDGAAVFCGSSGGAVFGWDCATGERRVTLENLGAPVDAIALGPASQRLAVAAGGAVRLFDCARGDALLTLATGGTGALHALAFCAATDELIATGHDLRIASYPGAGDAARERRRWLRLAAQTQVDALQRVHETQAAILEALRADVVPPQPAYAAEVHAAALIYATNVHDPAAQFFSDAILAATSAELDPALRAVALAKIRSACAALPDDWRMWPTLGLLQQRMGASAEAIATLERAAEAFAAAGVAAPPTLAAGLSLAFLDLGDVEASRRQLDSLRSLAHGAAGQISDPRTNQLLMECERAHAGLERDHPERSRQR